jgi:hypothetical protein
MKPVAIPRALARLWRRQELCLLVAVLVYAIYWTATGAPPRVANTLISTLFLGNFTMLALESLSFLYCRHQSQQPWAAFLPLLIAVTSVAVTLSTAIVFLVVFSALRGAFWPFLVRSQAWSSRWRLAELKWTQSLKIRRGSGKT